MRRRWNLQSLSVVRALGRNFWLTSNQYAKAYDEVTTVGSLTSTERPPDRTNVALFYASSSPTLVFNQAARQVAQEQGAFVV